MIAENTNFVCNKYKMIDNDLMINQFVIITRL